MTRYAVVAGGGTGGHVLLSLATARALVARGHRQDEIALVGSRRGQEADLLAGQGFPVVLLPGRGIARRLDAAAVRANLGALTGMVEAVARAFGLLRRDRPRVVVSVGGYAAFPVDLAALVLRVPLVLVNVDAVPGLVHRLVGRFAAAAAVSFAGTPLPRAVVTGTAVRQEIVAAADRRPAAVAAARRALDLPLDRSVVAAVGGSLGAGRVNEAVAMLAARWAGRRDVALYHVVGRRNWERATKQVDGPLVYRVVPFEEQMALLYQACDVLVCRAGAITVAEVAVAGVPAVLVPLPGAPGDHQTANARALVDAGAGVLLPDERCDAAHLAEALDELLADPARRLAMSQAARRLGHPDAADRVAEVVSGCAA